MTELVGEELRDDIKARLTMLQSNSARNEARELRRRALILETVTLLHDAAHAIVTGKQSANEFAARLVKAAEDLGTI